MQPLRRMELLVALLALVCTCAQAVPVVARQLTVVNVSAAALTTLEIQLGGPGLELYYHDCSESAPEFHAPPSAGPAEKQGVFGSFSLITFEEAPAGAMVLNVSATGSGQILVIYQAAAEPIPIAYHPNAAARLATVTDRNFTVEFTAPWLADGLSAPIRVQTLSPAEAEALSSCQLILASMNSAGTGASLVADGTRLPTVTLELPNANPVALRASVTGFLFPTSLKLRGWADGLILAVRRAETLQPGTWTAVGTAVQGLLATYQWNSTLDTDMTAVVRSCKFGTEPSLELWRGNKRVLVCGASGCDGPRKFEHEHEEEGHGHGHEGDHDEEHHDDPARVRGLQFQSAPTDVLYTDVYKRGGSYTLRVLGSSSSAFRVFWINGSQSALPKTPEKPKMRVLERNTTAVTIGWENVEDSASRKCIYLVQGGCVGQDSCAMLESTADGSAAACVDATSSNVTLSLFVANADYCVVVVAIDQANNNARVVFASGTVRALSGALIYGTEERFQSVTSDEAIFSLPAPSPLPANGIARLAVAQCSGDGLELRLWRRGCATEGKVLTDDEEHELVHDHSHDHDRKAAVLPDAFSETMVEYKEWFAVVNFSDGCHYELRAVHKASSGSALNTTFRYLFGSAASFSYPQVLHPELHVESRGETWLTVEWEAPLAPFGGSDSFRIIYGPVLSFPTAPWSSGCAALPVGAMSAGLPAGTTSYNITSLASNTEYYVLGLAINNQTGQSTAYHGIKVRTIGRRIMLNTTYVENGTTAGGVAHRYLYQLVLAQTPAGGVCVEVVPCKGRFELSVYRNGSLLERDNSVTSLSDLEPDEVLVFDPNATAGTEYVFAVSSESDEFSYELRADAGACASTQRNPLLDVANRAVRVTERTLSSVTVAWDPPSATGVTYCVIFHKESEHEDEDVHSRHCTEIGADADSSTTCGITATNFTISGTGDSTLHVDVIARKDAFTFAYRATDAQALTAIIPVNQEVSYEVPGCEEEEHGDEDGHSDHGHGACDSVKFYAFSLENPSPTGLKLAIFPCRGALKWRLRRDGELLKEFEVKSHDHSDEDDDHGHGHDHVHDDDHDDEHSDTVVAYYEDASGAAGHYELEVERTGEHSVVINVFYTLNISSWPYPSIPTIDDDSGVRVSSRGTTWLQVEWSSASSNLPGAITYCVYAHPELLHEEQQVHGSACAIEFNERHNRAVCNVTQTLLNLTGLVPDTEYHVDVVAVRSVAGTGGGFETAYNGLSVYTLRKALALNSIESSSLDAGTFAFYSVQSAPGAVLRVHHSGPVPFTPLKPSHFHWSIYAASGVKVFDYTEDDNGGGHDDHGHDHGHDEDEDDHGHDHGKEEKSGAFAKYVLKHGGVPIKTLPSFTFNDSAAYLVEVDSTVAIDVQVAYTAAQSELLPTIAAESVSNVTVDLQQGLMTIDYSRTAGASRYRISVSADAQLPAPLSSSPNWDTLYQPWTEEFLVPQPSGTAAALSYVLNFTYLLRSATISVVAENEQGAGLAHSYASVGVPQTELPFSTDVQDAISGNSLRAIPFRLEANTSVRLLVTPCRGDVSWAVVRDGELVDEFPEDKEEHGDDHEGDDHDDDDHDHDDDDHDHETHGDDSDPHNDGDTHTHDETVKLFEKTLPAGDYMLYLYNPGRGMAQLEGYAHQGDAAEWPFPRLPEDPFVHIDARGSTWQLVTWEPSPTSNVTYCLVGHAESDHEDDYTHSSACGVELAKEEEGVIEVCGLTGHLRNVTGLNPGVVYHWDVVATNTRNGRQFAYESIEGATFTANTVTATGRVPAPGTTSLTAATMATLTLTFDGPVMLGVGKFNLSTGSVRRASLPCNSTFMNVSGSQVIVTVPAFAFVPQQRYHVTIDPLCIVQSDRARTPVVTDGFASNETWFFTTAAPPPSTAPAVPVTRQIVIRANVVFSRAGAALSHMSLLNIPRQEFETKFCNDVANALAIAPARCRVDRLTPGAQAGTVVVRFTLLPDPSAPSTRPPQDLVQELEQQLASPSSAIFQGEVTQGAVQGSLAEAAAEDDDDDDEMMMIGIGVAIGVGVLLLIAVTICCVRYQKKKAAMKSETEMNKTSAGAGSTSSLVEDTSRNGSRAGEEDRALGTNARV